MVEHVLAKDEMGVRFSLPAPESKAPACFAGRIERRSAKSLILNFKPSIENF